MNFDQAVSLFNTRQRGKKARDYKTLFHDTLHLKIDGDVATFTAAAGWDSHPDPTDPHKQIYTQKPRSVFATLTRDNVLTYRFEPKQYYPYIGGLWLKLTGFGNAFTDRTKYAGWDNPARFTFPRESINVPLKTGLQVNTAMRTVVTSAPDTKVSVNRERSKPIYEYVDKVIKVMQTVQRLDGYDTKASSYAGRHKFVAMNLEMTDENIAAMAEAAFHEARHVTQGPFGRYVEGKYIRSEDDHDGYRKRLVKNAKAKLTAKLQAQQGALDTIPTVKK